MSLASVAGALLKPQTSLQQLLEDINFQRTKEMRQMLKDDGGFVVLQGTTYWTDLFVRHFLFQAEPVHSIDSDDLLFFVRKKHVKSSSRHMPKYETEVEVFRKDSRKLPIGDPDVDWEETVYLNMVIHKFDYTLTLAICTRTSPKELQVLRRHSQRVYASPSRRKMDTKGEGEEITYPHICFMVDNFDEVFSDIMVRDGEMVCVELVANDKDGAVQGVIFLGSIRYDALKQVYDARQSSLSSKVAQRMSFGLFSSGASVQTRCEFVRMKGPQGKGHAEMAVTKPKGSGVETPTSEPGFCATDMWDDWEEDNEEYCNYRHQRRLSDPSANLNNFVRYSWRTKNPTEPGCNAGGPGSKARSENEGLDSLANEVSEIEAGDLRDEQRPAFSVSATKLHTNPKCEAQKVECEPLNKEFNDAINKTPITEALEVIVDADKTEKSDKNVDETKIGCASCFGKNNGKKCKRWVADKSTPQMSEIYCPTCNDVDISNATPDCLNKMPNKQNQLKPKSILNVDSELVVGRRGSLRLKEKKCINRSASMNAADRFKGKLKPEDCQQKKEKQLQKQKEKDKENIKNKEKIKYKPKENKDKEKATKTSNLLAKVSPKRMRKKLTSTTATLANSATKFNKKRSDQDNKNDIEMLPKKTTYIDKLQKTEESKILSKTFKNNSQEYEIADDAASLNGDAFLEANDLHNGKMAMLSDSDKKLMIAVHGREELPVVEQQSTNSIEKSDNTIIKNNPHDFKKCVPVETKNHPLSELSQDNEDLKTEFDKNDTDDFELIEKETEPFLKNKPCNGFEDTPTETEKMATLPRCAKRATPQVYYNRALDLVPKRRTRDGTNIYYWCDLPKKMLKELDDGAYNPLWASRGFTQTFHFWKEHRRAQCVPLNAFLTYVTLPWWSIAKDLLDHRETPILTF